MGLCKHFVHNARYAKCLHRPIVIINQQYIKGEIHFINEYHRIQVALIHKYFLLSNCPSSDDVTNERKVFCTIVMIDFVLQIINTPHRGLLINKNKNRDNLIYICNY